jgi:hypothetical protein
MHKNKPIEKLTNCAERIAAAETELRAFLAAVEQLLGADQSS